ncbi:flavin monoamine oxidase family protein [Streptomyces cynarae]|uniref:flavin monoamine oxidase family protein n=1 Tax=Streptomyces cynarae TaxID=2981134 RepID=UPI00406CE4FA
MRTTTPWESTEPLPERSTPAALGTVPADGLPDATLPRRRVLVIGAGMAGLVAGYELLRRGHEPLILEARARVGGRIHTVRDLAPGLYAEFGAMRIPRVHALTLGYCREFGLALRPGTARNPRTLAYVGGRRLTLKEAEADPRLLPFPLASYEANRTREEMWREATEEIRELYQREGKEALEALAAKYDAYSIRGFLKARGWSEGAIERHAVMSFSESTLNTAVMQEFREVIGEAYDDVQEVVGGMDRLPMAFYERLASRIRFGVEVVALEQDGTSVTVRARVGGDRVSFTGDEAICTLPFSVLRGLEVNPAFSHGKQKAVRQLHYDAATKIFFQVRRPFWEETDGIRGGTTVTDLPVRRVIYPAHPDSPTSRTVLLASYTWGQDALQWSAMSPDQRVERALRDVSRIHPEILHEFEAGISHSWYQDPYAMGAYALFEPEQQTSLAADINRSEGRIHFAGEHCSQWPAWIEGAVESGIRAARRIHLGQTV